MTAATKTYVAARHPRLMIAPTQACATSVEADSAAAAVDQVGERGATIDVPVLNAEPVDPYLNAEFVEYLVDGSRLGPRD